MDNFNNLARMISTEIRTFLILSLLLLTGCSGIQTRLTAPEDITATTCRDLFQKVNAAIDNAAVRDYGSSSIKEFPYLRITRLLASFSHELSSESPPWAAWIGHMADLDAQARALELRNLPFSVTNRQNETLFNDLNRCRELLITVDLTELEHRTRLRDITHVPDDYVGWWQALGLYPLTAPIVAVGISAWHRRTYDIFAMPLTSLPVKGKMIRWAPTSTSFPATTGASLPHKPLNTQQIGKILYHSLDSLGIPLPTATELNQLFETFAPIWEVDVVDENDHIGMVLWKENEPSVDITRPTLYHKVSHTRFGNLVLLQLNYVVWFPARPGNDIYAGQLDGINWRVTLGPDGEPWLYDTIHNCGCYHQFFLSRHLQLRKDLPSAYFEFPLLPQLAPEQQPLVLRIAHHTHFIQRVYQDKEINDSPPKAGIQASQPMLWKNYDELRSLPSSNGYLSLFGKYGLVTGTERAERFLLWPMGIRSPGAMRQWGRHPTAFNGRRHFDDAFLIESLFEKTQ